MRQPAITTSTHPPMTRSSSRTWPGLPAQPTRRRRGRHAARDLRLRLLVALGAGAATALIVIGLILAVAG